MAIVYKCGALVLQHILASEAIRKGQDIDMAFKTKPRGFEKNLKTRKIADKEKTPDDKV